MESQRSLMKGKVRVRKQRVKLLRLVETSNLFYRISPLELIGFFLVLLILLYLL